MTDMILKMLIPALLLGVLALAAVKFFKNTRNQTKSQTTENLKRSGKLRVGSLALALLTSVVYMFGLSYVNSKRASAVISLNYAEASLGQNVNGTRYNMSEIICDDVLERLIKKGGLEGITVGDLKNCFGVSPLIQGNSYSKEHYHVSTEFVVYYYASRKTGKYSSDTMMQLLCNSYRDYYFDKYVNDFDISLDNFYAETEDLDYMDAVTLLQKKANKITNYLYGLQYKNSSFVSSDGATFASLAAKTSNLSSSQIYDALYAFVLQNGISKDAKVYERRLAYINSRYGFDREELDAAYNTTSAAVKRYDKDMARIVLVPTLGDDGNFYMGRTNIGIDELSLQAVEFSSSIATLEKSIKDNELKIEKFKNAVGNTDENKQAADELIKEIQISLKVLAEEARSIGREYYSNRMNRCVSASVYTDGIMSQVKKAVPIFVLAYLAFWAYKTAQGISENVNGKRRSR